MSDNVVPLFGGAPEKHGAGEAFCLRCKHEWVGVAPIGADQLECPSCLTMKGVFRFPFEPKVGEVWRECGCGNHLFYLTPEGHLCPNCGIYQSY